METGDMMSQRERTVWVVRHGLREDSHETDWFRTVGHMEDPDLAPIGREMATRVAGRLANERVDHIVSSPFLRCLRTADAFARQLNRPIKIDWGFHEQCDPKWFTEGLPELPSPAERARLFPEIDRMYVSSPGPQAMEPPDDPELRIVRRVAQAMETVLARLPGNLLIVTHYAVCNCLQKYFMGEFMEGYIEMSSLSQYVQGATGWTRLLKCDASHVTGLHPSERAAATAG